MTTDNASSIFFKSSRVAESNRRKVLAEAVRCGVFTAADGFRNRFSGFFIGGLMLVLEGILSTLLGIFVFNPVGWLCVAVAFWCPYQLSTALSAAFCGAATTAYMMWSLYGKKQVNLVWLIPVAITLVSYADLHITVLNGFFLTVGLAATVQFARREGLFTVWPPAAREPRW